MQELLKHVQLGRYVKLCEHFDDIHILRLYISIVCKTGVKNVASKQNFQVMSGEFNVYGISA